MQIHSTRAQGVNAGAAGTGGSAAAGAAGAFDAMLDAAVEAIEDNASLKENTAATIDAGHGQVPGRATIDAQAASAAVSNDELPADDTRQIGQVVDAMLSLLPPAATMHATPAAATRKTTTAAIDSNAALADAKQSAMRAAATGIGSPGQAEADSERAAAAEAAERAPADGPGAGFRAAVMADGAGLTGHAAAHALAAAQTSPASQPPANAATAAHAHVSVPFGSTGWPQAFGEHVMWSARQSLQSATLTLNAPELGPVQIELTLTEDRARAHFSSPLPEVRQAIEQALPQLKNLFSDAGIDLQQASVDNSPQQRQDRQDPPAAGPTDAARRSATGTPADSDDTDGAPRAVAAHRLLDLYA